MSYHSCAFQAFQKNKPPTPFDWSKESIFKGPDHVRPKAFFDMKMGDETLGRLVFELADDILPQTCANFIALCENRNSENDSDKNKDKKNTHIRGQRYIRYIKMFLSWVGMWLKTMEHKVIALVSIDIFLMKILSYLIRQEVF